jgi:hypothetical protein
MPVASLQSLLEHSIDYAGMFPPCSLDLEPALQNQAEYVRSPDEWMLGAFVLPVEQFDAAKQLLSRFDPLHPLRIAALGPRTENADAFLAALEKLMRRLVRYRSTMSISYPLVTSRCFYPTIMSVRLGPVWHC